MRSAVSQAKATIAVRSHAGTRAASRAFAQALQDIAKDLPRYLDPLLTISSFRVSPVVVMIDPAFTPTPDTREVADVFQVPLDVLMDPVMLERIELQFAGRARHVFQYRYQPQRIWGVTASILYNLRERLAGVGQGGA